MNDLLDMPEETPPWKRRAETLGIETTCSDPVQPGDVATWHARIEYFGKIEYQRGDTEREAINALIFRLKL